MTDQASARPTSARPMQRSLGSVFATLGRNLIHSIGIIAVLIAWEILARSGLFTPFLLPSVTTTVTRIAADAQSGVLFINIGVTVARALAGFALAAVLGIALGTLMARVKLVHWFFDPIISIGFPMPKIAFLPIIILWLGVYDTPKIFMIVIEAIFPIVTATLTGIAGVERELQWSARNMGANEREVVWDVVVPAASPQIMTGLQVALPIALIVAIVTEMLMGGYGVGSAMVDAWRFADSPGVFAGIVEMAIVGFVMVRSMAVLRRRMLLWHQEAMDPATV
jgi:ABC-type nitrate/sulfonate/bicarbonate transport system permease component